MNTIPITPVLAHGGTVQFVLRLVAFPVLLLAAPALWAQGTLDTTFNTTGKVQTTINANGDKATGVAVQSDGSNDDIVTIRYTAAGAFDTIFPTTTFSGTSHERGQALALQSDGKILVAGYTNSPGNYDFALVRFTTAGALDTTFNTTGKVITAFGTNTDRAAAMKLQADGRILVAGLYTDASFLEHTAVARYLAAPPAPDISVEQPTGTPLTDGTSTVAYGSVSIGAFLKAVTGGLFQVAEQPRGRLRSFLLGSLSRHVADHLRHQNAVKRGGRAIVLPLEVETAEDKFSNEPADHRDPEHLYLAAWAQWLVDTVRQQLRTHLAKKNQAEIYDKLQGIIEMEDTETPYRDLAAKLNASEASLRVQVFRLRRRSGKLLREEVARTVGTP